MLILGLDFETTGLDIQKDRPIEVGAILYSTTQKKCLESSGFLVQSDVQVSSFITALTGVTQSAVNKFGYDSKDALETVIDMMKQADAIIGQNVIRFDKRVLEAWGVRHGLSIPEKLWIDTRTDLPGVESKSLSYMACDAGFLNMFPHSALADVQTVIKLLSMHDVDAVVARAKESTVVLKAHVSYENNGLAKARKYGWYAPAKLWYKVVKTSDVPEETRHGEFDVSFVTDIPVETLWYS
jgi:DNA polymerase III epsilon subunit-like protein